jgi:hypothetical protein
MFPLLRRSTTVQRLLVALRLTRSFLLLEDDYDVDWCLDANELAPSACVHPPALHGRDILAASSRPGPVARAYHRRSGQPAPALQLCRYNPDAATADAATAWTASVRRPCNDSPYTRSSCERDPGATAGRRDAT